MKVLRHIGATRRMVGTWRQQGAVVALVPTMGNLHAGHISLVSLARRRAHRVVVSIFVNPTQFGPGEDYATYPRTLAADRRRLSDAGADALLLPSVGEIYPRGQRDSTLVSVPALSRDLCGAFRPGHFDGVTSVVLRLFNIVQPEMAVFGEKDYQQLIVLRRMAAELHFPVRIVGAPTIRERDGLAMSSRNQYLRSAERETAPQLNMVLRECARRLMAGERKFAAIERAAMRALERAGFFPDYVAIREAADLTPPKPDSRQLRVLAAARLGRARLIDNIAVRIR